MVNSIHSIRLLPSPSTRPAPPVFLQQKMREVFTQMKGAVPQNVGNLQQKQMIDFLPLRRSENFIEAGFWAGFWGLNAIFSGMSLHKLYHVLTIEHPVGEKFAKIGAAVKTAFVDLISLAGATAYNIYWAHKVKILSLGRYAPLVKGLSYGTSLVINILECGWSVYNIHTEKTAILEEGLPAEKEKHRQRICLSLMKVIGNISMIVWTMLGIGALTAGLAVSPILLSTFLVTGFVCSLTAFFYQRYIEKSSELPRPK
jgi:hypothetical protein